MKTITKQKENYCLKRIFLEAMGIEPMSVVSQLSSPTCLDFDYTYLSPQRHSYISTVVTCY